MHNEAEVRRVIAFLNDALAIDPDWVKAMVEHRPYCNKGIEDHPTIQAVGSDEAGGPAAGFIGLLNGIYGVRPGTTCGYIGVDCNGDFLNSPDYKILKFVYTPDDSKAPPADVIKNLGKTVDMVPAATWHD